MYSIFRLGTAAKLIIKTLSNLIAAICDLQLPPVTPGSWLHLSFALKNVHFVSCSFRNSARLPVIGRMFTDKMIYAQVRMNVYLVYPQAVHAAPGLHF